MPRLSRRLFLASVAAAALLAPEAALAGAFTVKLTGFSASTLRGPARVAVGAYHLNFITSAQATAVAGIGARTRLNTVLTGIDEALLRGLADEAHDDLIKQLAAAGLTVTPAPEIRAALAAANVPPVPGNLARGGGGPGITVNSSIKQGWVLVGPSAAPALTPYNSLATGGPMQGGGGFGALAALGTNNRLAKTAQSTNSLILVPALILDFVNMSAQGGGGVFGGNAARVGGEVMFSIRQASQVTLVNFGPNGTPNVGFMRLERDAPNPTPFATVEEGGAPVRVGSMTNWTDENYQQVARARGDAVHIDRAAWTSFVRQAFTDYNGAIVAELKKVRGAV